MFVKLGKGLFDIQIGLFHPPPSPSLSVSIHSHLFVTFYLSIISR